MLILIPGELIAIVTFPGIVLHEISHRFMCDILKVPVYEIKYFNIGSKRAGHVIHGEVKSLKHACLISFAPLIINSLVCLLFVLPLSASVYSTGEFNTNFFNLLLFWIGISSGYNAIPSKQDFDSVLAVNPVKKRFNLTYILLNIFKYIAPAFMILIGLLVYSVLYLIFQ